MRYAGVRGRGGVRAAVPRPLISPYQCSRSCTQMILHSTDAFIVMATVPMLVKLGCLHLP